MNEELIDALEMSYEYIKLISSLMTDYYKDKWDLDGMLENIASVIKDHKK